ncbi:uncharacterized protein LOC122366924 [Amphibalanus amphitrite]|uniref:uncharacterized protein LOC122366924 n=1 Tax=Amphibalanus amphitrite TaxID=1232801 RepID=UPI001C90169F|nr:uncharacterized protein LOC122366924 [Amphibalanus amphitrite]XP_043195528.1 uncharacterized protein LOC122366924 [Amphibalanus amphitrite]
MNRIGRKEQFIMAYGGLRGAVGFSLVVMLGDVIDKETAQVFVTCTLFIVLFTVFVQGSTVKVLVNFFRIKLDDDEEKTLVEEIVTSSLDHISEGVEEIVGYGGLNRLKERLETLDEKYLTPWLVHTPPMSNLARLYDKLVLDEHYANLYGPAAVLETQKDFDTGSITSSLPSYPAYKDKDRKSSLAADDGHLDLEPGWMRRKSILNSPNGDIKRRLSSAVNLPLPEDELAWLRRISATTPELPMTRPSLSDARRPSIMGDGRRPSLIPPDGLGLSMGRRSSTLPADGRTGSLQPPPLPGTGGRRTSIVNDLKQGFARRLSVFGATVHDQKDPQDEESGGRRDSVFLRSPSPQTDTQLLRHAIRENPFNKLHFRYNPNLVDEEDQEVETHLRRRRLNARRMSQMVFLPPTAQTMLAGLAEQGESSVPGSESLSRASNHRQSLRIRRSLRETPPLRSRSNSLQPTSLQHGNIPFVFGPKITKARGTATPESGSTASPEPTRPVAGAGGGHVNPTFVITEESDFESEPAGRQSGTATPPSPSPPESEGSTARRSSQESCSSQATLPAATAEDEPPSRGGRTGAGQRGPPPEPALPLVTLPTIAVTDDIDDTPTTPTDDSGVTISRL